MDAGEHSAGGDRELAAAAAPYIVRAMTLLGDRWTLAIIAQLFLGARSFTELRENLGIPRSVLAARLDGGEANGWLQRRKLEGERHPKVILTEQGRDLWAVLVGIMEWGNRHLGDEAPLVMRHAGCGGDVELCAACARCGERIDDPALLEPSAGPAIRTAPGS